MIQLCMVLFYLIAGVGFGIGVLNAGLFMTSSAAGFPIMAHGIWAGIGAGAFLSTIMPAIGFHLLWYISGAAERKKEREKEWAQEWAPFDAERHGEGAQMDRIRKEEMRRSEDSSPARGRAARSPGR